MPCHARCIHQLSFLLDSALHSRECLQVIAHTHFIDTHMNTPMAKRIVPMSLGLYNWTIAKKVHGEDLYFACVAYAGSCSNLKVLALTPAAEGLLEECASWQEFALVLQGLAQLGSLLHRAVAWPSLPCNTSWISGSVGFPVAHSNAAECLLPQSVVLLVCGLPVLNY